MLNALVTKLINLMNIKKIGLYVAVILLIVIAVFIWLRSHSSQKFNQSHSNDINPKVVINPSHDVEKKVNIVLDIKNHAMLKGETDLPIHFVQSVPKETPRPSPAINQEVAQMIPISTPKETPLAALEQFTTFHGLLPGDSRQVILEGNVVAEVYDVRSGANIANGTHRLTGLAIVSADDDQLKVDTIFDDSIRIGVKIPDQMTKQFHIGALLKLDQSLSPKAGAYGQYDFILFQGNKANWLAPLRVEAWPDGWRASMGIEVNF